MNLRSEIGRFGVIVRVGGRRRGRDVTGALGSVKVNPRSEIGRFSPIMRVDVVCDS